MKLARKIREELGFTRYKMARELKMSDAQYKQLEEIGKNPSLATLKKLFAVSGWDAATFWGEAAKEK